MYSTSTQSTLAQTWWPAKTTVQTLLRGFVLVASAVLLLTLSAKTQIPMWPVPITLQTLVVLVVGAAFGWKLGGIAIASYLAVGAAGAPVFASGGGPAYVFGPTGGFLIGFLLAAMTVGFLAEKGWDKNPMQVLGLLTLGTVIIFIPGLLWLSSLLGWTGELYERGIEPFFVAAPIKIAIGTVIYPAAWWITNRVRGRK